MFKQLLPIAGAATGARRVARPMPTARSLGAWLVRHREWLLVGMIAKLLMPGRDPGGVIVTILIGLAGSFIGTLLGRVLWGGQGYSAGWITSILGAVLLLWAYRAIAGRRVRAV